MARHKFKPGESGNPAGRPIGAKNRHTIYRRILDEHAEELINKAREMALEGNEQMLKLLLERVLPAKPKDDIAMIDLYTGELRDQSNTVLFALQNGDIGSSTAIELLKGILLQSEIIDKGIEQLNFIHMAKAWFAMTENEG